MTGPTVEDVAAELYALPLDAFTRERNARAAATDDKALAGAIRSLRKPSLAAWVVDLLVREAGGELEQALELGAALREAQDELDAATLAELTGQRRALVSGLARRAAAIAKEQGVTVSGAASDEVEKTLNAAMRDAAASDAVRTGRLVRTLDVVGFDPVDLDGAVAGDIPEGPAPAPRDDLAERRARKAAERTAREAAQAAGKADRELAAAEAVLGKARERADHVRERIAELRADLDRLETDAERAEAKAATAEKARDEARAAAKAARRAADAAESALPGGSGGGDA
jgi:hypothetical protein